MESISCLFMSVSISHPFSDSMDIHFSLAEVLKSVFPEVSGWTSITSKSLFCKLSASRIPLSVSDFIPPRSGGRTRYPLSTSPESHSRSPPSLGLLNGASIAIISGFDFSQIEITSSSEWNSRDIMELSSNIETPVGFSSFPARSIPTPFTF